MCDIIQLPDGSEVETINQLEAAFGTPVDSYHNYPEHLKEVVKPGETPVRDCCMCHVDLKAYLTAVGATWDYFESWGGDINVIMMPPMPGLIESLLGPENPPSLPIQ